MAGLCRLSSRIVEQHVPDGDDVADASGKYEEMEHGVHESALVEAVEEGSGDVAHALGHYPCHGSGAHAVDKRLEGNKHRQPHADETERLGIAVFLQTDKADYRSDYGAEPHEAEEAPPPIALLAQGYERKWRVAAGNMPVDGGVVPASQTLLPAASARHGMINGGGGVGAEHAEQVERDAGTRPGVVAPRTYNKENDAHRDTHYYACCVRPGVELLLFLCVSYCHRIVVCLQM